MIVCWGPYHNFCGTWRSPVLMVSEATVHIIWLEQCLAKACFEVGNEIWGKAVGRLDRPDAVSRPG